MNEIIIYMSIVIIYIVIFLMFLCILNFNDVNYIENVIF